MIPKVKKQYTSFENKTYPTAYYMPNEVEQLESYAEKVTAERDELREDLKDTLQLLKSVAIVIEFDPRESSATNVKHIKRKIEKKTALLIHIDKEG